VPGWSVDLSLSGRDLRVAALEPGSRVTAPGPCSVVTLISGAAAIGGRPLAGSAIVSAPGREIVAGGEGCMLGAVRWDGEPPAGEPSVESTDSRYFEKYDSFQAQLHVRDGARDLLAPWELYHVRIVAESRCEVRLHVHRMVTNVLFVRGPVGAARGYLVLERDGRVEATPLVGGDRAIVRPGLPHTVVPVEARDPIEMVVFNNDLSRYEDVEHSDFHLLGTVPWSEVTVRERRDPRPRLTVVP
jgi:hypothetical protein